jgi:hypothetical protein
MNSCSRLPDASEEEPADAHVAELKDVKNEKIKQASYRALPQITCWSEIIFILKVLTSLSEARTFAIIQ